MRPQALGAGRQEVSEEEAAMYLRFGNLIGDSPEETADVLAQRGGAAAAAATAIRGFVPRRAVTHRAVSSQGALPYSNAPLGGGARAPSAGAPGPCERSEQRLRRAAPARTSSRRAPGFESPERGPCAGPDRCCGARSKEEEDAGLAALEARLRGAAAAQGGEETHKALARAKAKARGPCRCRSGLRLVPCRATGTPRHAAASAR